jgi:trehalose utilization protein
MIRVTIWNEFIQDKHDKNVLKHYPNGIHEHFAQYLRQFPDLSIKCAWMEQSQNGLSMDILAGTDVLLWWSHQKNEFVEDITVSRVIERVQNGMGIIFLHSSHLAKTFKHLLGTSKQQPWRNKGELEKIWTALPTHPIATNIPISFELKKEEMYGEPFDIPPPDDVVFISGFKDGSIFRTGVTWTRGKGRVFYFRPGHETYPSYHNSYVLQIILNAIRWCSQ